MCFPFQNTSFQTAVGVLGHQWKQCNNLVFLHLTGGKKIISTKQKLQLIFLHLKK